MYSPKELEGEVDHSFFDSDCEVSGLASEDGQLNKQKAMERQDEKTGKETHVSMDQIRSEAQSVRNRKDEAKLEDDSNRSSKGQSEETEYERDRSDEGSSLHSYSSDEERELDDDFKLSKTNVTVNSDDDGYHRSDDESEEDVRSPVTRSIKHKDVSHGTPKKSAGKFHKLSHSRLSSSDPESSLSSEERSSFQSQKSPVKHQRVGSAYQKERQKETAESEDTVTDVTPLSTPNVSPFQSIDVVLPSEPVATNVQPQQQPSVTEKMVVNDVSDGQDSISSEGEDGPVFLNVEKQFNRVLMVSSPGSVGSSRKNCSFTKEEVREIDRENRRLLCELSRSSAHSRSSKTSSRRSSEPPIRLYHNTLNRQREQERIQKENLVMILKGSTLYRQADEYRTQCVKLYIKRRTSRPGSSPHKSRPGTAKLSRTTPRPAWS
uniref:Cilia- and flagella-associated protein 97 n=1 Tax=Cyprinus carpio TaxID=7962 RepID=A0A8C2DBC5_CYPCA